ncbi:MAG TPA: hypothetical protein VKA31_02170 [Mariprofundaceae bacterium]|nr:hypothetical protein [Mariprofundaceae bacterium]
MNDQFEACHGGIYMLNRVPALLVSALTALLVPFVVYAGGADILKNQCASCHNLTGPAPTSLRDLWARKGPDLFYAGNKYRKEWVEAWLQSPNRIRPAGMFYVQHIKPGAKHDVVDESTLSPHMRLNADDAKSVAAALSTMKANNALIMAEKHDPGMSPGPLGEMMFDKIYGCMACHQIEPGYGGVSGPEVYTAGKRLTPEFMLSYIRSPKAWDPKIWMPNKNVPDGNMQKLVNYLIGLSKVNFDE